MKYQRKDVNHIEQATVQRRRPVGTQYLAAPAAVKDKAFRPAPRVRELVRPD